MKHSIIIAPLLAVLICTTSCRSLQPTQSAERDVFAMDTFMTMKAYGDGAAKALDSAEERIHELEAELSVTSQNSDIARINRANGAEVEVSHDTALLVGAGASYWRDTDGALDISVYPVLTEWGFTTGEYHVPDAAAIARLLERVSGEDISVDGSTVQIPADSKIDLGALAKGYTGDEIMAIFRDNGVKSAMISLGGNVQALGSKPDGSDWRVGIKDPFTTDENMCVVSISDKAVVTSGNYERCFTADDGRNYWHIIDPSDGYPADNGLVSVTIIGGEGLRCDALSTALFVMGTEKAQTYLNGHTEVDAVLVTDDARILYTDGLADKLEIMSDMPSEVIARD
ncbi:thiamine biosynthesis lipoprotein [Ruminococcus sp. YRD2003]|uniref:FAD:protein FMN transferase n=1 Tax=Ruminococcus sp. YRD2003 TaxID=1452313 RepID=UPI0008C038D6|nr:thiamine biosynthesis lipoprotein [Ruminococcus flavefaciens]